MKINRKSFVTTIGTGFVGYLTVKSIPIIFFRKKEKYSKNISIKINPLAVSRNNSGGNNV